MSQSHDGFVICKYFPPHPYLSLNPLPGKNKNQMTAGRTEPNTSSVLGFPGCEFGPSGEYRWSFVITGPLGALLFLSDMDGNGLK